MIIHHIGLREIPCGGGIEKNVEEISRRLAKKHKVLAYIRNSNMSSFKGVSLVQIKSLSSKYLETPIYCLFSTIKACFSNCDIVHYHALGTAPFSFLPRLFGKKTVLTIQGLDWKRRKWKGFGRIFLKFSEKCSLAFPNELIVVSMTLKDYYSDKYKKKSFFIPNGFSNESFRKGLRNFHGLRKNSYILYVGRFVPEKGLEYLIQAYKMLDTDKKLVLAGYPSYTDDYARYLKRISSKNVLFMGKIKNELLRALYEECSFFVLPSEVEGMSLALLEAMGFGCRVLVSDIPENKELVLGYGLTFRFGDINDLKDKMEQILEAKIISLESRQEVMSYIAHNFSWDSIAEKTEAVYCSLLKNR
ncbi:MAG: glycosyltransferase family 4 protein [Nanoarchaeota archaeon]|nr:glycosyltransferase family 4 protein [Nanoarchaeota archaeon]MBU1005771.1 glycosyltransferase family 4 protein [Nanoarchaeota archaeon]MBU1946642.1 glycosyltransferase family 4 protein [Nanoarchaeota archaeon]